MRTNVELKNSAAKRWCEKMTATKKYGAWDYLFAQQIPLTTALKAGVETFAQLAEILKAESTKSSTASATAK